MIGGCALGFATGWNIANTGSVAGQLATAYGVGLAAIGLFTTALFVTHAGMQIPAGRSADRFGARRTGMLALTLIATFNLAALVAPDLALALVARLLIGVGTGLGFIAGSAYVRSNSGSAFAQGVYGGVALGGRRACACDRTRRSSLARLAGALRDRRSSSRSAASRRSRCAAGRRPAPAAPRGRRTSPSGVLRDARLYRLAVLFSSSLGLSVVLGNWVVDTPAARGRPEPAAPRA